MNEATVTIRVTQEQRQWLNRMVAAVMAENGRRISHSEVMECIRELLPSDKIIEYLSKQDRP